MLACLLLPCVSLILLLKVIIVMFALLWLPDAVLEVAVLWALCSRVYVLLINWYRVLSGCCHELCEFKGKIV